MVTRQMSVSLLRNNKLEVTKKEKDETPNPQVNKERQPQAGETPTNTSSSNHEIALLPSSQQEAPVLRLSGLDATMVATKSSQEVSAQQCFSVLYILIMIKSSWPELGSR